MSTPGWLHGSLFAVFVVVRTTRTAWNGTGPGSPPVDDAHEMLRHRYARGEIDAAEFEERKRRLGC